MSMLEIATERMSFLSDEQIKKIINIIDVIFPHTNIRETSDEEDIAELEARIFSGFSPEDFDPEKKAAFERLEAARVKFPDDFDYEKELNDALEEKYGRFN